MGTSQLATFDDTEGYIQLIIPIIVPLLHLMH